MVVLKSRQLVGKLVDKLELVKDPEFNGLLQPKPKYSPRAMLRQMLGRPEPQVPLPEGIRNAVIDNVLRAMEVSPPSLHADLGPAIGPRAFEVGNDVYDTFTRRDARAATAFESITPGKWLCDLFRLARQRLADLGIHSIHGGEHCTYSNPDLFFSHRRDKVTGRMAALIWLQD